MNTTEPAGQPHGEPLWTEDRIGGMVGWTLIRASLVFIPRLAAALAPAGISPTQFGVLVQVENSPGISQAALARRCYMTPQSMGEILPGLEERGLLVRGERGGRGRAIPVHLTESGKAALKQVTPAVTEVNSAAGMGLEPHEHELLNQLLNKTAAAAQE